MQNRKDKLEELRRKKEETLSRLNYKIAQAQRLADSRQRKEDTRYKIVVGACLLADLEANPQMGILFEECLKRQALPRDMELLRARGWRI